MKNKKGSHVGVVISFLLFITFVIFMYALLYSRISQEQGKTNSLENAEEEVLERVSGNLLATSVGVSGSPPQNCLVFNNLITTTGSGNKIKVKDEFGSTLPAYLSGGGTDLHIDRQGSSSAFFRVYSSDEFPEIGISSLSGCATLNEGPGYTIGLSKAEDFVFESKITKFLSNYTSNYEGLKTSMNLGSNDEFGFAFTYSNGTMVKTPDVNVTINVYADSIPVQYIKTDGTREAGSITVIVW